MIKTLIQNTKQAWALRGSAPKPPVARPILLMVPALIAFLLASIKFRPNNTPKSYHFYQEDGSVTVLSALLLGSAAAYALAAFLIAPWPEKRYRVFWALIALAVGFFAFDELLGFHEALGNAFDETAAVDRFLDQTGFRTLNDVMVISYGVIAIPLAFIFLPGLLRVPRVLELFVTGFLFYVVHTAIDSLVEVSTVTSVLCEESMKLFSSSFIALGALTGLRGTVLQLKNEKPLEPPAR